MAKKHIILDDYRKLRYCKLIFLLSRLRLSFTYSRQCQKILVQYLINLEKLLKLLSNARQLFQGRRLLAHS